MISQIENEIPTENRCLEFQMHENNINEINELDYFIDSYMKFSKNNIFSVKIKIPEKIMSEFKSSYLKNIISVLKMLSEGKFDNIDIITKFLRRKPLFELKLTLMEEINKPIQEISESFSLIFSQSLVSLDLSINLKNKSLFKTFNENFSKMPKTLVNLNLKIHFISEENISDISFLGNSVEYLENLKYFKLHLEYFHSISNYFLKFFNKMHQLKSLESLEIIFDKIEIDDDTLKEFFNNFINNKLDKLRKLYITFQTINSLEEMNSFPEFLSKLHEINIKEFGLEFKNVSRYSKEFMNVFEKVQKNEKIETLKLGFKNYGFYVKNDFTIIKNYISKFVNIKCLELAFCQIKLENNDSKYFIPILNLENVLKIEQLRLILGYNQFSDEFVQESLEKIQKLVSLKYLFLDLQQSWNGTFYLTNNIYKHVIVMLEYLKNLESILFNFDGNEIKRERGSYDAIEEQFEKMRKQYGKIKNYKIMEKNEVVKSTYDDIKEPNYECHLPYEYFFNDFKKLETFTSNLQKKTIKYQMFEIVLQECQLQDYYTTENLEKTLKEFDIESKFEKLVILVENPIYNPNEVSMNGARKALISDFKRIFERKATIHYSFFFEKTSNECIFSTPVAVKIDQELMGLDEVQNLKTKNLEYIDHLLNDWSNKFNLIAKTPSFVQILCQNEDILVNFSVINFEKIMVSFNIEDAQSITLFVNQIFITTLNVNMKSELPALILSKSKYCKYLTCESFSFLSFYAKKVAKINGNHNLSEIQKEVHCEKIKTLTSLHMEENPYFSTRSCKESLLELIDNKWKLIKLRSPDYFYDNDFFVIETKKERNFLNTSTKIKNSINEFYSNIREAIKDFEIVSLDDFYGDFILSLFLHLPYLTDVNLSNLNLGDKFCEGFNTFVAAEKKKNKGEYRFINLEIINNLRISNVGLKFLYVSYQIIRNYFRQKGNNILPKLKVLTALKTPKKKKAKKTRMNAFFEKNTENLVKSVKKMKKVKKKKEKLPPINDTKSKHEGDETIIEISKDREYTEDDEYEEVEVTDEEGTVKHTQDLKDLLEKDENMKIEKIQEEEKKIKDKVSFEINKKKLDDDDETIILNEGLGAYIQHYIKNMNKPKRFFCYNCDCEVCKECHKFHPKSNECQPDFLICEKENCGKIHHKDLIDCKIENQSQVICRGFRQILEHKMKNMDLKKNSNKTKNKKKSFFDRMETCFLKSFDCVLYSYYNILEKTKKCIMVIRRQFERCCVGTTLNEKGDQVVRQGRCLSFLNCFFGDPDTVDDELKEFKFNKNIIQLNHDLGDKRLIFLYSINFILYYFLVAFAPIYFKGENTVRWESHIIYAGYAVLVFLFETYLTYFIIKKVNTGKGNKILKDFSLANYLLPLILSQVKKYDFYTDVVFIIANINENRDHIAIIAGTFLAITTFTNLMMILTLFKSLWNFSFRKLCCFLCIHSKKIIHPRTSAILSPTIQDKFSTFVQVKKVDNDASNKNINIFCKISSLLELECIGNCLDKFSTKNAWFFPYFGGYYIPQQIVSSTLKFFFEDLPGFVIQLFVLSYYYRDESATSLTPIIVTTIISLLASVTTVLTAKASILKQEELKLLEQAKIFDQQKSSELDPINKKESDVAKDEDANESDNSNEEIQEQKQLFHEE